MGSIEKVLQNRRLIVFISLAFLVLVTSLSAFGIEEFVYDAEGIIKNNPRVTGEGSWGTIWTTSYWGIHEPGGLYRPFTISTYRFEYTVLGFGSNPLFYLITNLLLHLLATWLVFGLGYIWFQNFIAPMVACSFFAVHPIVTSVTSNLVGRADLLLTVFVLVALIGWEKFRGTSNYFWMILSLVAWFLALLSKETAAVIPLFLLIRDYLFFPDKSNGSHIFFSRRSMVAYGGFFVVGLGWLMLRVGVLGGLVGRVLVPPQNVLAYVGSGERMLTALKIIGLYTSKIVFPFTLSADYSFARIKPTDSLLEPFFLLTLVGLITFFVSLWFSKLKKSKWLLGIVFYLVTLLPVCNLLVVIGTIMADRLLYFPLVGASLAIGAGFSKLIDTSSEVLKFGLGLIVLVVLSLFGGTTLLRHPIWANERVLWAQTVRDAPPSTVSNYLYALELIENDSTPSELKRAMKHAKKSVIIARDFPGPTIVGAYHSYGAAIIELAQRQKSQQKTRRVLKGGLQIVKEGVLSLNENLKGGYQYAKDGPRAKKFRLLYRDLGVIYFGLRKLEKAKVQLKRALDMNPTPNDRALLGRIAIKQGKYEKAVRFLSESVREDPDNRRFREWLEQARTERNDKLQP